MSESYVLLWAQDRIKWLQRAKDNGPLEVVFGGPHISMPSIDRLEPGDLLYPLSASKGQLLVLACLKVSGFLEPDDYVRRKLGLERPPTCPWNVFRRSLPNAGAGIGHRVPHTCAELAACGEGTEFVWNRPIPSVALESLRFGSRSGRETPLKHVIDGQLQRALSLHGHMRRASRETAEILASTLAAASCT